MGKTEALRAALSAAVAAALVALSACSSFVEGGPCESGFGRVEADFDGAGMAACAARPGGFDILIEPEDEPINPSPWYAVHVIPSGPGEIGFDLIYADAEHRYQPKISADGETWRLIDPGAVEVSDEGARASIRVETDGAPFYLAGQELLGLADYEAWMRGLAETRGLEMTEIGRSREGRPLFALVSAPPVEEGASEHVLFIGRQHPPELTGAFAMMTFIDRVFADDPLSNQFRARFHVTAAPLLNPDGVYHGHWRHTLGGVDLNRDWGPFTEPEARAVLALADEIDADPDADLKLMLDFHSTDRNVFYTQTSDDVTDPPGFTETWLAAARARLTNYEFERAERHQSDQPTAKNYFFARFGAPSITYEVGDDTDRAAIAAAAVIFAEEMMRVMLAS